MPKSLKWILLAQLLMLLLATAFRLAWVGLLAPELPAGQSMGSLYLKGFLLDARFVAVAGLVLWLLGHIPDAHFFKTHTGKHLGLWVMVSLITLETICLAIDFVSLASEKQHLQSAILRQWLKPDGKTAAAAWGPMPVIPMVIGIAMVSWLSYLLLRSLHVMIQKKQRRKLADSRVLVQASFVALMVVLFFGVSLFNLLPNRGAGADLVVDNIWQAFFRKP